MASTPNGESPSGSQSPTNPVRPCSHTSCTNTGTLKCARCKTNTYCSKNCQKQDWRNGHRDQCRPQVPSDTLDNYVLRIQLYPERIRTPPITRKLSCPANATFHQLHRALQVTFSWATTHTYDFIVNDPSASADGDDESMQAYISRLTGGMGRPLEEMPGLAKPYLLRLVEPRLRQPGGRAIDSMHDRMRRNDDSPGRKSTDVLLRDVFEDQPYRGQKLEYCYDFGDTWMHDIKVVARKAPTSTFECLGGQGHAAAEDVGCEEGWEGLLKAYRAERPSQEQKETMSWYERQCSNGDARGLKGNRVDYFDKDGINQVLQRQENLV